MTDHEPIGERIARVETKLDMVLDHLRTNLHPLDLRVKKLENWRSYILGAGAFIGAALSWIAHLLAR